MRNEGPTTKFSLNKIPNFGPIPKLEPRFEAPKKPSKPTSIPVIDWGFACKEISITARERIFFMKVV
jgi:hypothetical protein